MNTSYIAIPVGATLLVALTLGVAVRFRRSSPFTRYTVFAILLGVGGGSQVVAAIAGAVTGHGGTAVLFLSTFLLMGTACILEMRKLRREF